MSPLVRPAQDLNWLITNFVERVPSVAHAIVVSSDGLPMAFSHGFPADRVDQLAAVTSGLTSLTQAFHQTYLDSTLPRWLLARLMMARSSRTNASLPVLLAKLKEAGFHIVHVVPAAAEQIQTAG